MIDDFRDFLRELVAANAKFLVVGAHALSVHGIPRATGALDVWVRPDADNASRLSSLRSNDLARQPTISALRQKISSNPT